MKIFLHIILLFSAGFIFAREKVKHDVDFGITYTFLPNERVLVKSKPCCDIHYFKYKKYTYPSVRLRYTISKMVFPKLDMGAEAGITFRYMEKYGPVNYITFYSFPVALNSTYHIFLIKAKKKLLTSLHLGYHFKHQKYSYLDGKGGIIGSWDIGIQNIEKSVSYKLGYEVQHDRYVRDYSGFATQHNTDYIIKYHQYINQVYFSVMLGLK